MGYCGYRGKLGAVKAEYFVQVSDYQFVEENYVP